MYKAVTKAIIMLDNWIERNGWSGYDPYDIKGMCLFRPLQKNSYSSFISNALLNRFPTLFRKIFKIRKEIYADAMANFARGYLNLYKKFRYEKYLNKAIFALNWLIENSNRNFKGFCWGLPFDWQTRILIPKNTPCGVTTAMSTHAFLDAYETLKNPRYLEVVKGCCVFLTRYLKVDYVNKDELCFSYTPLDNFHIHNANLWIASAILRANLYIKNKELDHLAVKALNFTIKHQNDDGSWFYWAPPDKLLYQVDNYHTGFILECLNIARRILKDQFKYEENLKKGLDFYIKNLFLKDGTPKFTKDSCYPIDTHSCAQAIITFNELADFESKKDLVEKVTRWTIKHMQSDDGYFYYRIYKYGNCKWIDKTPYIRWQAWMLRALSYVVNRDT